MKFLFFLRLYVREAELNPSLSFTLQFALMLAPLLFNLAEYSVQLYRLVKKRSSLETLAVINVLPRNCPWALGALPSLPALHGFSKISVE